MGHWVLHDPTLAFKFSWNAYESNISKPRSGVRWKHMKTWYAKIFWIYGHLGSRIYNIAYIIILSEYIYIYTYSVQKGGMPECHEHFMAYIYIYIMRCSMYGIFTYIHPKNGPNVGKYSIHGASGIYSTIYTHWFLVFFTALCAMSCRSRSRR